MTCSRLLTVLLMLVIYMCSSTIAGFAETPASVEVELGTAIPPCRCRHNSPEADIFWRVNGLSSGLFPAIRSGFINESGIIVHTLMIPSELQYNGTKVECLAVFLDGSPIERTPAATILFTETLSSSTNSPTTEPGDFELVPSSLTVAVEQGTATFQCRYSLADSINWLVDGVYLNRANLQNIFAIVQTQNNVSTSILSIATLIVYNRTTVQCVGTFFDGSRPQSISDPVTLLIQDTPKKVVNISHQRDYASNALTAMWSPLPTLDLTDIDPDIIYTVELFKITCGKNLLMNQIVVSGNNATEEDLDQMQIYKIVLAARNNVSEAKNGPSVVVEEIFMSLNGSTLFNLARYFQLNMTSLDPVPSFYVIILTPLDGHGKDLSVNITVQRINDIISMIMEDELPSKSLWNASILAYGCETDATVTELSTHDIQNVIVSSPHAGQIRVVGDFVDGSSVTEVLLIIYSLTNELDVFYIAKEKEHQNMFDISVTGLYGTEYGVSGYALENGLPFPRVVASPKNVVITNDNNQEITQQPTFIQYKLHSTSTGVCITCTFLNSSTTGCVAVVHQRISQLSSGGLMNIESSHKFNRSGDTAYGCIKNFDQEQYQLGIIGGKIIVAPTSVGEESSPAVAIAVIIVSVLGVTVLAVIAALMMMIVVRLRMKERSTPLEPYYMNDDGRTTMTRLPSSTLNNESGFTDYNRYVDLKMLKEEEETDRSAEEQPLLNPDRVVADGASIPHVSISMAPESHVTIQYKADSGSPQVNRGSSDNGGSSDPTYAQAVPSSANVVSAPAATEKVVYEDIQGFQNQQGQVYTLLQLKFTSKGTPADLNDVMYSEIQPQPNIQSEIQSTEPPDEPPDEPPEVQCEAPNEAPSMESNSKQAGEVLTTELLLSRLSPLASKWQSLGLALSLDDDRLDEIYTNNEGDDTCLSEMVELYMMRSDVSRKWEEIEAAIKKVEMSSEVLSGIQESERDSSKESLIINGSANFPPNNPTNTHGVHIPDNTAYLDQSEDSFKDELPDKDSSKKTEMDSGSDQDSGYNSGSPPSSEHTSPRYERDSEDLHVELPFYPCSLATSAAHRDVHLNSNDYVAIHVDATELEDQSENSFEDELPDKDSSKNVEMDDGSSQDSGYNSRSPPLSEHTSPRYKRDSEDLHIELPFFTCSLATSAAHRDVHLNSNDYAAIHVDATELEDYESDLASLTGSEATIQGCDNENGDFNRTKEKNNNQTLDTPVISSPMNTYTSTVPTCFYLGRFLEKNQSQDSEDELCKLSPLHYQDSNDHCKNYLEVLTQQMGLQVVRKPIDNNAVEELSSECTKWPLPEAQKLIIREKEWTGDFFSQPLHAWKYPGVNRGSVSPSLSSNQTSMYKNEDEKVIKYQSSGIVSALNYNHRSIIPPALDTWQSHNYEKHPTRKLPTFISSTHVFESDHNLTTIIICTEVYSKYPPNLLIAINLLSNHWISLLILSYAIFCIPYLLKLLLMHPLAICFSINHNNNHPYLSLSY